MRLYFAPMEGVVDHPLRKIYEEIGGIDVYVTEFIRVTHTRLPKKVFLKYSPELKAPLSIPVRIQLLGSNPDLLAYHAAKAADLGAPAIDLNFGCPAKTVNRHRGGACLLDEPELLYQIVSAVRSATPKHVPVTAKIRLGFNAREGYVANALAIESAGANELVVHGRSKADLYRPPAYWRDIGEIKDALTIPVIANGDIWSVSDFLRCKAESGCSDFMLGRGILSKPDLALAIKAYHSNHQYIDLTWADILPFLHQLHAKTLDSYPKKYLGNRLKQWLMYLRNEYPEAAIFFQAIKKLHDEQDIRRLFNHSIKSNQSIP